MLDLLLKLFPKKLVKKQIPGLIAKILTWGLTYLVNNYPDKSEKIQETAEDIGIFITTLVKDISDNKITKEEIEDLRLKCKDIFTF